MNKRNEFIWKATADKRYENFIHTVPDCETVWLAGSERQQLSLETEDGVALCVWPGEEFAAQYLQDHVMDKETEPFALELKVFMDQLEGMVDGTLVCVFPSGQDDLCTEKESLLADLEEELEMYE